MKSTRLHTIGKLALFLAMLVAGYGCSLMCCKREMPTFPERCAPQINAKNSIIIIPGLNTAAQAFNQLTQHLCAAEISPTVVDLSQEQAQPLGVWRSEVAQAVNSIRRESPDSIIAFLGYSMGALLTLDYLAGHSTLDARAILVAPAVEVRALPQLLLNFAGVIPLNLEIPSMSAVGYRAARTTSINEYKALLALQEVVSKQIKLPKNTVVITRRNDSLVSSFNTDQWLNAFVPRPEHLVLESNPDRQVHSHLLVDQRSIGEAQWPLFINKIIATAKED